MKCQYNEFNNNEFEVHKLTLDFIEANSCVLDIGCATGFLAKELLKKKCEVWGLDYNRNAIARAARFCKKALIVDLNESATLPVPKKHFDYIILLDVIEHLLHPEKVLSLVKPYLKNEGVIIVSTPNIAHASIRWMIVKGQFQYTKLGILDSSHLHFYTRTSFSNLLKKANFKILKIIPTNGMTKVPMLSKISDQLPRPWQYWLVKKIPELFSYQFIAVVKLAKSI